MSRMQVFSDEVLIGLLRALRARSASHPDNPWLVAFWPRVREEQMAAACGELTRRGHEIRSIVLPGKRRGVERSGWAVAAETGAVPLDAT